jgi:trimethylamine:corrinoid methyltransferase-like protein
MTEGTMAVPRLTMLSHEQCEAIHRASLEILRRTGVRIYHAEAIDLLRQTDAVITEEHSAADGSRQALVRFPPGLVGWALKQAPPSATGGATTWLSHWKAGWSISVPALIAPTT